MKLKAIALLALACLGLSGCATRIEKLAVPPDDTRKAYQLMVEGDRLLREGKDHLALLAYVEASTLNPYHETIFNKLAIAYSRLLLFHQARKAVTRAIRLNREYAFAFNTKGIIELASQRPGSAVAAFRRAIELRPDKPAFFVNLGNAYLHKGEFELGRRAFLEALKLDPDVFKLKGTIQVSASESATNPERYYEMAKLYAELGDKASSLYYLEKALSAGFRDRERLDAEAAFEGLRADEDFNQLIRSYGMQS